MKELSAPRGEKNAWTNIQRLRFQHCLTVSHSGFLTSHIKKSWHILWSSVKNNIQNMFGVNQISPSTCWFRKCTRNKDLKPNIMLLSSLLAFALYTCNVLDWSERWRWYIFRERLPQSWTLDISSKWHAHVRTWPVTRWATGLSDSLSWLGLVDVKSAQISRTPASILLHGDFSRSISHMQRCTACVAGTAETPFCSLLHWVKLSSWYFGSAGSNLFFNNLSPSLWAPPGFINLKGCLL